MTSWTMMKMQPTVVQMDNLRPHIIAGPLGFYAFGPEAAVLGPRRYSQDRAEADLDAAIRIFENCPLHQQFDAARAAIAGVAE